MFYFFSTLILKVFRFFLFPWEIKGSENIPAKGAFILASNHISYLDPLVIPISCKRRLSFVSKQSLFEKRFVGWFLRNNGAIPLKRESSDIDAMKKVLSNLKNEIPVLIFPEGTRVPKGKEKKALPGIGFLVAKSKKPVVPVYVSGAEIALPPGAKKIKRHKVTITYGKPITFGDKIEKDDYQTVADTVMKNIFDLANK